MNPLRIAVIGAGAYETSRSRTYQAVIKKLTDLYTFCAICDRNTEACRAAAETYDIPAQYTDVEEMLRSEKPDVVFCLTPTDSLNVMAVMVAKHQINVITEIPIAVSLPIADAITETCRQNGVKYEIAENVWHWPHEQLKQKIVRAGTLGKIRHARLWYASGSYHGFNGVRKALGLDPRRVLGYAQELQVPPYATYGGGRQTTRWWESAVVEHEGNVTCLYEMPPSGARGSHWDIEGTGGYLSGNGTTADELVLYRDGKAARYPFVDVHEQAGDRQVLTAVRVDTDPPVVWENPFAGHGIGGGLSAHDDVAKASILTSLHRAVTEGRAPEYGAGEARRDLEVWIGARESALQGSRWLELPLVEQTELERRLHEQYVATYGGDPTTDAARLLDRSFGREGVFWTVAGWL
jgi:predicted dehydrogenase